MFAEFHSEIPLRPRRAVTVLLKEVQKFLSPNFRRLSRNQPMASHTYQAQETDANSTQQSLKSRQFPY